MTLLSEQPVTRFRASTFAPAPPERRGVRRDHVRLLVGRTAGITHAHFRDLPDFLAPGDLVVVNDSATMARQVDGVWARGEVIVHFAMELDDGRWVVELRTPPRAQRSILDATAGDVIEASEVEITLVRPYPEEGSSPTGSGNRLWTAAIVGDVAAVSARPISYGYLDRSYPLSDYQTVFGFRPGSAEMPSAGRPFTHELVTRLVTSGIALAPITLHTGVSSQETGEAPQPERFSVSPSTARLVNQTRKAGGRVIAVGTTVVRALESAVSAGHVEAASGWTTRVVTPAQPPAVVNGLITGWHDPEASHLLLVEAVAGPELTQRAYDAAVAEGYLWHEFGDSALLLPG
ncbi:S-adenosylmethionine:tRNA ribosyltransferase-isomerase [Smaragdicoccus niigatensis]|uniref:S-adenosylmethionine:tRNA ribosyltransferase-isomerase n=1 Tax=Smaragdicoccus niigatensis TaxID=359359 RepID=UPI00037C07D3|nr:S-adenosylmethionine:tRNA ribosyltransferase-isomerase [Smaragdicoccus niigatensis]